MSDMDETEDSFGLVPINNPSQILGLRHEEEDNQSMSDSESISYPILASAPPLELSETEFIRSSGSTRSTRSQRGAQPIESTRVTRSARRITEGLSDQPSTSSVTPAPSTTSTPQIAPRSGSASDRAQFEPQQAAKFRNNPEYAEFFERFYDAEQGKFKTRCKLCDHIISAHMYDRLRSHIVTKCPMATDEIKRKFSLPESFQSSESASKDMNNKLAKIFIKNNVSLRILDCPLFKQFIREAYPERRLASRTQLSSVYIRNLALKVDGNFGMLVKNSPDYSLTIEFDHWSDAVKRSILGVMATTNSGQRHIISLQDVSLIGHSSTAIVNSLNDCLSFIPARKINAIVSDNASNCVLARSKFVAQTQYKHVIQQRCIAHWLNLIGSKFCEAEDTKDMLVSANKLANFLLSDPQTLGALTNAGANRCKRSVPTRWYSTVTMLESLLDVQELAEVVVSRSIASGERNSTRAESLRALRCELLWPKIRAVVGILRPLADCIAVAESNSGTLASTMKTILGFAKMIITGDWTNEHIFITLEAFFQYFSLEKLGDQMGLLFAAYFVDKSNNMDYITVEGQDLVYATMSTVGQLETVRGTLISDQFSEEFFRFCEQTGSFKLPCQGDAVDWWSAQPDIGVMRSISLRIAKLRSSSANIERVFSVLKAIQSPQRLNCSLQTLSDIAKVRVADFDFAHREGNDTWDALFERTESSSTSGGNILTRVMSGLRKTPRRDSPQRIATSAGPSRETANRLRSFRLDLFTRSSIRKNFESFIRLVDFDIVNNPDSDTANSTLNESCTATISKGLKKLEELRKRKRS